MDSFEEQYSSIYMEEMISGCGQVSSKKATTATRFASITKKLQIKQFGRIEQVMKQKLNQRVNFNVYLILGDYEEQSLSNTRERKEGE